MRYSRLFFTATQGSLVSSHRLHDSKGRYALSYAEYACSKNFWPSVSADGPPDASHVCVFPSSVMFSAEYRLWGTMYLRACVSRHHTYLEEIRRTGHR